MSTVERIPLPNLAAWTGGDRVVLAESTPLPGTDALCVRDGDVWAVTFARPTYTHGTNLMLHGDDGSGRLVSPAVVAALEDLVSSPSPGACGSGCAPRLPHPTASYPPWS